MRRLAALVLLCACLAAPGARAMEDAYLPGDALMALEPAYEAFLQALADALIDQGLLRADEREQWLLYQLGDYHQNGGYGSIIITYTPGITYAASESVSMRRLTVDTAIGQVRLDTLRRYAQSYSTLPGLPLDVELTDETGAAVPCRFRWSCTGGGFLVWDSTRGGVVDAGVSVMADGRPLYWYAEAIPGIDETLTLEIIDEMEDSVLDTVAFTVTCDGEAWTPEVTP